MAKLTIKGILAGMGAVLVGIGSLWDSYTFIFVGTMIIVIASLMIAGVIKTK